MLYQPKRNIRHEKKIKYSGKFHFKYVQHISLNVKKLNFLKPIKAF